LRGSCTADAAVGPRRNTFNCVTPNNIERKRQNQASTDGPIIASTLLVGLPPGDEAGVLFGAIVQCKLCARFGVMSKIAPSLAPSAPQKPRARRLWALALLVILMLVPLHWLLFQGQEVVPSVVARPVGRATWSGSSGGAAQSSSRDKPYAFAPSSHTLHV
jgi:hypothetical protein